MKANPVAFSPIKSFRHGLITKRENWEASLREYAKGHAADEMSRTDTPDAVDFFTLGYTLIQGVEIERARKKVPFDVQTYHVLMIELLREIASGETTLICTPAELLDLGLLDQEPSADYGRVNNGLRRLQRIAAQEILKLLGK